MNTHIFKWIIIIIVLAAGIAALLGPEFVSVPLNDGEGRARLLRDDFELSVFHQRGDWVRQGITPYDESIFQEYPQVGLAYISFPYVFSDEYGYYRWVLITINVMMYVGLLFVSYRLLRRLDRPIWYLALLIAPSMLYFSFNRFDIVVALLVQIGLWLILSQRWRWAAAVFAAAFLTKWYPILFLPLIYIYIQQTAGESKRKIVRQFFSIGTAIVIGVLAISFAIDGFTSLRPYLFHGTRGGGVGSLYFMLIQGPLLQTGIEQLNYLGLTIFLLLQFGVPLFAVFRTDVVRSVLRSHHQLILWMALAVLLFTLFSRFYSPQWIIWLLPLVMLIADKRLALLTIGYDALNYISFPIAWQVWGPFSWQYATASAIIAALLVMMLYQIFRLILAEKRLPDSI